MKVARNQGLYLVLCLVTVVCGLYTRSPSAPLPKFIATYAGDTLWALMVFLGLCTIARCGRTRTVAVVALVVSFAIEFSQLYQAPWINEIRHTKPGGLVLGFGFKLSDLVCYSVGVLMGVLIDLCLRQKQDPEL